MPKDGCAWWHLIITARNTWLPGDIRGFRNYQHRIHSSGDYNNPPPPEEHAGLRTYFQQRAGKEITFPKPLRKSIANAMLATLHKGEFRCLALAVAQTHCHVLVECADEKTTAKRLASRLKQVSSFAIREELSGKLWGRGRKAIRIKDHNHQRRVFHYILRHSQKEGAWVWNYST